MTAASTLPPAVEPDSAIIAESLERPERFGALYDRHHATVFRYVRSRIGDDALDDVVADTFVEAFRTRERFRTALGDSCTPWLLGIATNMVARRRGAEQRWLRDLRLTRDRDALPDEADDTDARVTANSLAPWLTAALAQLRRRDRDALLLHVAGDLSIDEVAHALEIPAGTVKSRLSRARRILAAHLEERR